MAIAPYVEQPLPASSDGFVLVRPPHRMERLMRVAMRFVGLSQIALAILLAVAATRLDGANSAIAGLFAATFALGSIGVLWWMGRSGGVHRLTVDPERIVLHRAGFGGFTRRVEIERSSVRGIQPESVGEGRASSWRLWLVTPNGPVELAVVRRTVSDLRPARVLAERLAVELVVPKR